MKCSTFLESAYICGYMTLALVKRVHVQVDVGDTALFWRVCHL